MSEAILYSDIVEIVELYQEEYVNKFLDNGWLLIKVLQNNLESLNLAGYVLGRTSNVKTKREVFDKLREEDDKHEKYGDYV